MDPVMQTLFGKMPIEQLDAVKAVITEKRFVRTIFVLGGITIGLGIFAYTLYQQNLELKDKLNYRH